MVEMASCEKWPFFGVENGTVAFLGWVSVLENVLGTEIGLLGRELWGCRRPVGAFAAKNAKSAAMQSKMPEIIGARMFSVMVLKKHSVVACFESPGPRGILQWKVRAAILHFGSSYTLQ